MNDIVSVSSLKEVEKEVAKADKTALVIFDVDEVLITTEDHFIHPYADKTFMGMIYQAAKKALTDHERKDLEETISLSIVLPKRILVEDHTPSFIYGLRDEGYKTMALTSCPTGNFGVIPQIERWRIDHLRGLNICFASSFPEFERHSLESFTNQKKLQTGLPAPFTHLPLFEEGILFSYGYKKGAVLKEFFQKNGLCPSQVLFVDDLMENLQSVKDELSAMGIPFKGFHYQGAAKHFKPLNEKILHYQFHHLMKTRTWLSDSEVAYHLSLHSES